MSWVELLNQPGRVLVVGPNKFGPMTLSAGWHAFRGRTTGMPLPPGSHLSTAHSAASASGEDPKRGQRGSFGARRSGSTYETQGGRFTCGTTIGTGTWLPATSRLPRGAPPVTPTAATGKSNASPTIMAT